MSAKRTPRPCQVCGIEFTPLKHAGRTICSEACETAQRRRDKDAELAKRREATVEKHRLTKRKATCPGCGMAFLTRNKARSFCSAECRRGHRLALLAPKACAVCGRELGDVASRRSVYCSPPCRTAARKEMSDARLLRAKATLRARPTYERQCVECDGSFQSFVGTARQIYCSVACKSRRLKRMNPSDNRKRARKFGVGHEPVNRLVVFDRDGWRCQICGIRTPRTKLGKMVDNAPELEHRIPMAKGGAHSYANCQCACRKCNGKKGAKHALGQLPLFDNPKRFYRVALEKGPALPPRPNSLR